MTKSGTLPSISPTQAPGPIPSAVSSCARRSTRWRKPAPGQVRVPVDQRLAAAAIGRDVREPFVKLHAAGRTRLSKRSTVYTPTVARPQGRARRARLAEPRRPRGRPGARPSVPRGVGRGALGEVLADDVAADVGGLDAPVGVVAEDDGEGDGRAGRRARSRRTSCSRRSRDRSRPTACRSCPRPRRGGSAGRACCGRSPWRCRCGWSAPSSGRPRRRRRRSTTWRGVGDGGASSRRPSAADGPLDHRRGRHLAAVGDGRGQQRAVQRRQRRVPESGRRARELEPVLGHVEVRRLDGEVEGDGLARSRNRGRRAPARRRSGGGSPAWRRSRSATCRCRRRASRSDGRGWGGRAGSRAGSTRRRRGSRCGCRRRGRSTTSAVAETTLNTDAAGAQGRSASSAAPRRGSAAERPTIASTRPSGDGDDDGRAVRDLEGSEHVVRALLQPRIERQLGAPAVRRGRRRSRCPARRIVSGAEGLGLRGGRARAASAPASPMDDEKRGAGHNDTVIHVG